MAMRNILLHKKIFKLSQRKKALKQKKHLFVKLQNIEKRSVVILKILVVIRASHG